jgi:hypothetical protein
MRLWAIAAIATALVVSACGGTDDASQAPATSGDPGVIPVIGALVDALTADRGVVVGQGESASVEFVPDHDARIKAARELLDRAYGKARQALEVTGDDGGPLGLEDARHGSTFGS